MRSLSDELDLWGEAGHHAEFWWRDDDAGSPRPEFSRILDLAQGQAIPLSVAVIPASAQSELLEQVENPELVSVLQHGWSHANHEPDDNHPSELGEARSPDVVMAELTRGRSRLIELFGAEQVWPVLVPPWHSMSARVMRRLPQTGIFSVSLLGWWKQPLFAPRIAMVNADADLVRWDIEPPEFIGSLHAIHLLTNCLRARRLGPADMAEPVGILTHHWAMDRDSLTFLTTLGQLIHEHPAARWITPYWAGSPFS